MNENKQTPDAPITSAQIRQLIGETHSALRPDPCAPSGLVRRIPEMYNCGDRAIKIDSVRRFFIIDVDVPQWEPEYTDKLEDYLYGEFSEEEADSRVEALRAGAALTADELEHYESAYYELDVYMDYPIYYVKRVSDESIQAETEEEQSIFFIEEYFEMGQYGELLSIAGPFCSQDEAEDCLFQNKCPYFRVKKWDNVETD